VASKIKHYQVGALRSPSAVKIGVPTVQGTWNDGNGEAIGQEVLFLNA